MKKIIRWVLLVSIWMVLIVSEVKTSFIQSLFFITFTEFATYHLDTKPDAVYYPKQGPANQRLGYVSLPDWIETLNKKYSYDIFAQANLSEFHKKLIDNGINPLYTINPTGFEIYSTDKYVYNNQPVRFKSFEDIPPVLINILLFIENKDILNDNPYYNPAIEYDRFAQAIFVYMKNKATFSGQRSAGGSTLATQIEKFSFSKDGKTNGAKDKMSQIISGSLRSYLNGRNTTDARKNIILNYFNLMPLGASSGFGEVIGYLEGAKVFYNIDIEQEKQVLSSIEFDQQILSQEQLDALNRVLQILISVRNPSYLHNQLELCKLKDIYINLLIDAKFFNTQLVSLNFQPIEKYVHPNKDFTETKSQDLIRKYISSALNLQYYQLDRVDLKATSTIRGDIQQLVTNFFKQLNDEQYLKENNLRVDKLLDQTKTEDITYSFILYQLENDRSKIRTIYDNSDRPFSFNDSGKMELGSTAKLRVLTCYLDAVSKAYEEKQKGILIYNDPISQFVRNTNGSLKEILEQSVLRTYSASPREVFFTGGGTHVFENYKKEDNSKIVTIRESLTKSINLPFVRVLRDVVRFYIHRNENYQKLVNKDPEAYKILLSQFVEKESRVFLYRFYKNLKTKKDLEQYISFELPRTMIGSAAVISYIHPEYTADQVLSFIRMNEGVALTPLQIKKISEVVNRSQQQVYNINDLGYLAKMHPIMLYVAKSLIEDPELKYGKLVVDSRATRIKSYDWLFKKHHTKTVDMRIYTTLEQQGFEKIFEQWKSVGFPFEYMIPSLASALGSSGDKPKALAKLVGIILNNGTETEELLVEKLHFAQDTPYEAILRKTAHAISKQVLKPEIAVLVRDMMSDVVNQGTAIRIKDQFGDLVVGGKTGTGDNKLDVVGKNGKLISSTTLSRTATFVFYIGDSWYGNLTVYIDKNPDSSTFTSSYPVALLKLLSKDLLELIEKEKQ